MARRVMPSLLQKTTIAAAAVLAGAAHAQVLPDPTQPPPGFVAEQATAGGASMAPVPAIGGTVAKESVESPWVLQSVLIPKRGTPVAIISGQYVPQGEQYRGHELQTIREGEAVLVQGKAVRVLKLTPLAEKSVAPPPAKPEQGQKK